MQEELSRVESYSIISPVEEPTPWCAGMIVVPRLSGAVKICVDFQQLNESASRSPPIAEH